MTAMLCEKEKCTGCGACANVCPLDVVSIVPDEYGFYRPSVDHSRCTECGACERACPVMNMPVLPRKDVPRVFACWNKDADVLAKSTSGGMFTILAEHVLERGGAVFGAVYDENLVVRHRAAHDREGIAAMRKSKYVQSDTGTTFAETKHLLENGTPVLYTGTPCQIAGLYGFLGGDHERLLTCGLICHGVPSAKMFRSHLNDLEKSSGKKIVAFDFRDKSKGWSSMHIAVTYNDRSRACIPFGENLYGNGFLKNFTINESCFSCCFRTKERLNDVAIGDCWGIRDMMKKKGRDCPIEKGSSAALLYDEKAESIFHEEEWRFESIECTLDEMIQATSRIVKQIERPPGRSEFLSQLDKTSFDKLAKKYFPPRSKTITFGIRLLKKVFGVEFFQRIKKLVRNKR